MAYRRKSKTRIHIVLQYFVSILVPVYNVAPYIGGLLQQLAQLHGLVADLELIFVDDGSSDRSLEIVEKFIEETALPNATVIRHDSNRGLSATRNTLMDAANGAHVWFIDGDDLISVVHAAEMLKGLREAPAECLLFDFLRFRQGDLPSIRIGAFGPEIGPPEIQATRHFARTLPPNETVTDRETFLVPYLLDELHYSWAIIAQRALLTDLRFPEHLIFEDQAVTPRIMLAAKSVRYHPVPIVLYRDRSDSLEKQRTYKAAHDLGQAMFSCLAAFEGADLNEPERTAWGVCLLRSLVSKTRKLSKLNENVRPEAEDMLRSLVGEFKRFIGDQESDVVRLMSKRSRSILKTLLSPKSDLKEIYASAIEGEEFTATRAGNERAIKEQQKAIARLQRENRRLNRRLSDIKHSTSWKLTYPFRRIAHRGTRRVLRQLAHRGWLILSSRAFGREDTSGP